GERAYEHPDLKHGVFFHFVIQGLKGEADHDKDQKVDLDELVLFTKKRVADFVRGAYGKDQTPNLEGRTRGVVPLVNLERSKKGFLGTVSRPPDRPLARRLNLEPGTGALVEGVFPGSPADKAELRKGDVVLKVDGQAVAGQMTLVKIINACSPGATLRLELVRDGQPLQVQVALQEMTDADLVRQYRQQAEQGEAWAQNSLGARYANGQGIPRDYVEAVKWYRRAA